jgi:hypothetical protein
MRCISLFAIVLLVGCAAPEPSAVRVAPDDSNSFQPAVDYERSWPFSPPEWARADQAELDQPVRDRSQTQIVEFFCEVLRFSDAAPSLEAQLALTGLLDRRTITMGPRQLETLVQVHQADDHALSILAPRILTWIGQSAEVKVGQSSGPGMRFYCQATEVVDGEVAVRFAFQAVESYKRDGAPRAWEISGAGRLADGHALATFIEPDATTDAIVVVVQTRRQHGD